MARVKLTDGTIRKLAAPQSGNLITYDSDVRGFGIRITSKGARSFVLNYCFQGRERRYTIGAFPAWGTSAARKRAGELRQHIDAGHDPLQKRQAELAAPTVSDLCKRYLETHVPRKRPSSQKNDKSLIERVIRPQLGTVKVAAVRYADIEALHRKLAATPYQANRLLALVSKMFSLAIRWGWTASNPTQGVERYPEDRRERFLSPSELERLWQILALYEDQDVADAVRLLVLTGARRGEVLSARWDQIDLSNGVWTKPSSHTKQKKLHRAPLSRRALAGC